MTETKKQTQPKNKTAASVRVTKKSDNTGKNTAQKTVKNTAQKTAKNTAQKNTAKQTGRAAKQAPQRELDLPNIERKPGTPVSAEIFLWVVFAFCVILLLSNFFGFGGVIGNGLSRFFFGIFGAAAYLFPFILFLLTAFLIANRGKLQAWVKTAAFFLLYACICAFCELLSGRFDSTVTFAEYYSDGSDLHAGGGILGGLLCRIFCPIFGQIGAWICLLAILVICAIVITEHSVFDHIRGRSSQAYRRAKRDSESRHQLHELKRENSQLKKKQKVQRKMDQLRADNEEIELEVYKPRRDLTVSGVSTDTGINRSLPASDEIHEVVPHVRKQPADMTQTSEMSTAKKRVLSEMKQQDSRAKKLVDSVDPKKKTTQMDMDFTIQRDGVSRKVGDHADLAEYGSHAVNADNTEQSDRDTSEDRFSAEDQFGTEKLGKRTGRGTAKSGSTTAKQVTVKVLGSTQSSSYEENSDRQADAVNVSADFADATSGFASTSSGFSGASKDFSKGSPDFAGTYADSPEQKSTFSSMDKFSAVSTDQFAASSENEFADDAVETAEKAANDDLPKNVSTSRQIRNPRSSKEEQEKNLNEVSAEIEKAEALEKPVYMMPPLDLLNKEVKKSTGDSDLEVKETAAKLQQTLHNFGVNVSITNVSCGPTVTRYELLPEQGVKVSRIVNLSDDIKLNLAAADIRIEAPIPGKSAVGIEVPNKTNSTVYLRELLESDEFQNAKSNLSFAVGRDIAGNVVVADIAKMPHLLIAGATGSGKSVCINTLIMSLLYKADPEKVKLIMIDPKIVELSVYNGIPHLYIPVVTDPKKAVGALNWGVAEMNDRYAKFAACAVRDLKGYNQKIDEMTGVPEEEKPKKLPQIVIIVDELAELMQTAPGEVEDSICRLAQLARAAGIHLIIATQRPSVNVITGLIKANMPSRIAFSVTSGVDSRTIIDMNGAEKLLGKGDMLFYPQGYQKPARVQGAYVSDKEVSNVTEFLTQKNDTKNYQQEMEERLTQVQQAATSIPSAAGGGNDLDANFAEAGKFIIEKDKASIGMLQRVFKIGFNRAARIMDQLADAGVVGPEEGTKPRKVLMSMEEFEKYLEEYL